VSEKVVALDTNPVNRVVLTTLTEVAVLFVALAVMLVAG
jgi:hypothetical protein